MQKRQPNLYKLIDKSPAYIKRLRNKTMHKYLRLNNTLITLLQYKITDPDNGVIRALKAEINFYYDQFIKLNGIYIHNNCLNNSTSNTINKLDKEYIDKVFNTNNTYIKYFLG